MQLKAGIMTIVILILLFWGINVITLKGLNLGLESSITELDSSKIAASITDNELLSKVKSTTKQKSKSKKKPVINRTENNTVLSPNTQLPSRGFTINSNIKRFVVKKSIQKMYVYFGDTFKVFKISLGGNPIGHKIQQGDKKTPEGTYHISFKNPKSRGYKSLKISYPNEQDRSYSYSKGLNPGGDIFIHGLWWPSQDPYTHWRDNWTNGCIAVNNSEIDEIYKFTNVNTVIQIYP
jgi:murein L,D-transpeptidase YafK